MNIETIFVLQFILSFVAVSLLAKWYVAPWLAGRSTHSALIILTLPHTFRHLGLAFLIPGLVSNDLPQSFANAAAYGDFASGLLAIVALLSLRYHWRAALPIIWIFNVIGTADLVNALRQAEVIPHLLTTWYIPTFVVPVLLVTHGMIFVRLLKSGLPETRLATSPTPAN